MNLMATSKIKAYLDVIDWIKCLSSNYSYGKFYVYLPDIALIRFEIISFTFPKHPPDIR